MTLVNAETGEVVEAELVEDFTETEAREHTEKINVAVGIAGDLVVEAWNRRIWTALGYRTWEDYCREEIRYQLTGESKAVLMVGLRNAGASYRAIGAAAGVSKDSAQRELSQMRHLPDEVTGTDGKTYPSRRPEPSPEIEDELAQARELKEQARADAEWAESMQPEGFNPALNRELIRQRGELSRLCKDLVAIGDPADFYDRHDGLRDEHRERAEAAHAWLGALVDNWRTT